MVKERMWASLDGNFWFGGVTAAQRHSQSWHTPDRLPDWRYLLSAFYQTPVAQVQLQRRDLHPLRRQLSECVGRVAVLVDRQEHQIAAIGSRGRDHKDYKLRFGLEALRALCSRAGPAIEDNLRSRGKRAWFCRDNRLAYGIGSNTPPSQTVLIAAGRSSSRRDTNT